MSVMTAALFVETGGVYFGLPDVDPWDEQRDARLYPGPWPVVAHPPCSRWCQLAPMNAAINGLAVGDDGGAFEAALAAVHTYGGVLEHPAFSYAWPAFELPRPLVGAGWQGSFEDGGWSCYVEQGMYGHAIRKPTWLYAYGVELPAMRWRKTRKQANEPGWYVRHDRGTECKRRGADRIRDKRASATPPAFRDVLARDGPNRRAGCHRGCMSASFRFVAVLIRLLDTGPANRETRQAA
jgi:hypothetical protein